MARNSFASSVVYAVEGIRYAFATQINMRIHGVAAIVVITAAALLHVSGLRWLFLLLAITLVMVAEMLNTAIEAAVDLTSPDLHPLAKAAKDTAAGAVLLAAVFAIIVGIIVFYRPVLDWLV
ncbi:diacylglycerol kinase family protein [Paenibacillus pini]|uniref:Diacylglycerol kinase n=1 Tax=Paenibacillus pini JCM 16418 TaxID=1236976 RepID=W7YXA9_9BACL|nr:diacylglycerol kinase family protein [Paenibacillus pini]GAF07039.1 diacylglycerol kinase [Paenibacillus pini JCM 16418]